MPNAFFIAVDVLALLGTISVFIWWLVRRREWRDEPHEVLFKAALSLVSSAALIAIAHWIGFSYGGAFLVPFCCVAFGVVMSVVWAPHIGELIARPLTSLFDGGSQALEPRPLYSIAEAKRK